VKRKLQWRVAKRKNSCVVLGLTVRWRERNKRSKWWGVKWGRMDLHLEESRVLLVRIEGIEESEG